MSRDANIRTSSQPFFPSFSLWCHIVSERVKTLSLARVLLLIRAELGLDWRFPKSQPGRQTAGMLLPEGTRDEGSCLSTAKTRSLISTAFSSVVALHNNDGWLDDGERTTVAEGGSWAAPRVVPAAAQAGSSWSG